MNKRAALFTTVIGATLLMLLLAVFPAGGAPRTAEKKNIDGTIDMPIQGSFNAGSSFYQAGVVADDIDRDGRDEMLVGNTNGNLYCFNTKAKPKWVVNLGASIQGTPACYDVDGDRKKEIWVGDMAGRVWGFNCRGQVLSQWGWPKQTPGTGGYAGVFSSPAIGDVNNDGTVDIVVGTWGHHIFVWSYTGVLLPGWPYDNKDTIWSSPALADIDGNGVKEIIIGADATGGSGWQYPPGGLLYAFRYNLTQTPGFPKITPEVTWSSPAVVDVNRDGAQEIFVGTGHYYRALGRVGPEAAHRLYGYRRDGSPLPGWPVPTTGCTFSSPAIGDIDGDRVREIVVGTNAMGGSGAEHVMAFKPNGRLVLDRRGFGGPMMGSPCLADVNHDGRSDIIMGSGIQICAWTYKGNVLWNQNLRNMVVASPVAGDFDRDGRLEVAAATGDAPGGSFKGGGFYIFDCGSMASGRGTATSPWPMFRLDPMHHAAVSPGQPVGSAPKITSLFPTAGTGDGPLTVTIRGNDFGDRRGESCVMFGKQKATWYTRWKTGEIRVNVPARVSGKVNVRVVTSEGTSNGADFEWIL